MADGDGGKFESWLSNFSTLDWWTKLCLGRVAMEAYSLETRNLGLGEAAGLGLEDEW